MIYAIDLDGVVINWDGGIRRYWNATHDRQIPLQSTHWESPFEDTGLTHAEFWQWVDDSGVYYVLPPMPNALAALHIIGQTNEINYVTARHENAMHATEAWLKDHGVWHPTVHTVDKIGHEADVYVDDNNGHLQAYVEAHPSKFIFRLEQPWNEPIEGTYTILSLIDLVDYPPHAVQ